jgi:hypothetical protein
MPFLLEQVTSLLKNALPWWTGVFYSGFPALRQVAYLG